MPNYEQTIVFRKKFTCTAANAEKAMAQLEDYVSDVQFDANLDDAEYYEFEDEEPEEIEEPESEEEN